jgi:hypothetical protein
MLNWLSLSTQPDLTTVHSLLVSATESPSPAHLDALQHVDRYIKATSDYGISFSSRSNAALEAFIQFPLNDNDPTRPCSTAFADSNWGPQDASTPSLQIPVKSAWMKQDQSVDISFFFPPTVLFFGKATKRNATVKVHAKLKSKLLTNVRNQFNGFVTSFLTYLYLITTQLQSTMTTWQLSCGLTAQVTKSCAMSILEKVLSVKLFTNTRKFLSNTFSPWNTNPMKFTEAFEIF